MIYAQGILVAIAHNSIIIIMRDDLTGRSACVRFEEDEGVEEECRNKIKKIISKKTIVNNVILRIIMI